MAKTDDVKAILEKMFGPASAAQVDKWVKDGASETDVVAKARAKVEGFLGKDKAAVFDSL